MVQGRTFYAIWDEARGLWSRDEYDVQRLVDEELDAEADRLRKATGTKCKVKYMRSFQSNSWTRFRQFLVNISDNSKSLDSKILFSNSEIQKKDYASKHLSYALGEGEISAWDELVGTLYSGEERAKIEWAIGSVVAGYARRFRNSLFLQSAGSVSPILNVIEQLFGGYTTI
jgi:hypothetical protein